MPAEPEIEPDHTWLLSCFYDLATTRPIGAMGGFGLIPYTAIIDYIRFWDFDDESSELLIHVVRESDSMYVEHLNSKQKNLTLARNSASSKPSSSGGGRGGARRRPSVGSRRG